MVKARLAPGVPSGSDDKKLALATLSSVYDSYNYNPHALERSPSVIPLTITHRSRTLAQSTIMLYFGS